MTNSRIFNPWTFILKHNGGILFVYQVVQFTIYHILTSARTCTQRSTAGNLGKLWTRLAGSFDRGTSGKDHRRTSCASSRKTSSFYLGVYSGSCCRTQIPSSASFSPLTFSIIFSYSPPFSSAKGQNEVAGTDARLILLSSSCLSVCCSMLDFWLAASGHWEPVRPLY